MPKATKSKKRLLIVDDEPGNIRILSNILADDYVLSAATNAKTVYYSSFFCNQAY